MKTIFISLMFLMLIPQLTYSQDENNNEPNERVQVNKEYDENGNLIRFDSIYSYSSSNMTSKMDSIFENFSTNRNPFFNDEPFNMNPFPFPNNFKSLDSIWQKQMLDHRSLLDDFFQMDTPKKDSIQLKKKNKI